MPAVPYSEESWILFYMGVTKHCGERRGRELYFPSPSEIEQRKYQLRYLQKQNFTSHEIASILQYDMPDFLTVFEMCQKFPAVEVQRRIQIFLLKNEYTEIPNEQNAVT